MSRDPWAPGRRIPVNSRGLRPMGPRSFWIYRDLGPMGLNPREFTGPWRPPRVRVNCRPAEGRRRGRGVAAAPPAMQGPPVRAGGAPATERARDWPDGPYPKFGMFGHVCDLWMFGTCLGSQHSRTSPGTWDFRDLFGHPENRPELGTWMFEIPIPGHVRDLFGLPGRRGGRKRMLREKRQPVRGSRPESVPWGPVSWPFSVFAKFATSITT